jgi:hypothetical protein
MTKANWNVFMTRGGGEGRQGRKGRSGRREKKGKEREMVKTEGEKDVGPFSFSSFSSLSIGRCDLPE